MGGRGNSGSRNSTPTKPAPYNPTQDMDWAQGLRRYRGHIYSKDLGDYGEENGLTDEEYTFVRNGQWVSGSTVIGSYVIADGSHANIQFSRDRSGTFYVETLEERRSW